MTGYVIAFGPCIGCKRSFGYNPHWVPSIVVNGEREPICRDCVALANPRRQANGLAEIVPHPDAYEPLPESDL
jgi:hypothetical protein